MKLKITRTPLALLPLLVIAALILSCSLENRSKETPSLPFLGAIDPFDPPISQIIWAEQNWTPEDSLWFYRTPQGSTLLPYDIFLHLEEAEQNTLFRGDANLNRLRYLPQAPSPENPDGLAIGWVKESYKGKAYIGLTCAACHTAQLNVGKTGILIDGAPGQADMDKMMRELESAISQTLNQPDKLQRLHQRIISEGQARTREDLQRELASILTDLTQYNRINAPLHDGLRVDYGFARLDAFGRIYNRIFSQLTPHQDNFRPASAPVSYPFLWDTPQHDFVQWNGIGDNADEGHVGRNTGEVLGVFASFDVAAFTPSQGYPSSALINELVDMEQKLTELASPSWRQLADEGLLPPINEPLASRGADVYREYQCHQCHALIDSRSPERQITAQFASLQRIQTDPTMAINALQYQGASGHLKGRPLSLRQPEGEKFGDATSGLAALSHVTEGVIINALASTTFAIAATSRSGFAGTGHTKASRQTQKRVDFTLADKRTPASLLAYKARPLNGIWATAPYLHNGSVPTLEDLFKPSCSPEQAQQQPNCRPNQFTLGSRELDPQKVGFKPRSPDKYPDIFVFDTQLPGNSNKGHEFTSGLTPMIRLDAQGLPMKNADGTLQTQIFPPLSDSDRQALVEYLKTL